MVRAELRLSIIGLSVYNDVMTSAGSRPVKGLETAARHVLWRRTVALQIGG